MKISRTRVLLVTVLWLAPLAAPLGVCAQMPSAAQSGINAAMVKLFGGFSAFTSRAEVRLLDKHEKETMQMPMSFALLDGMVRAEMSLAEMRSAQMPRQVVTNLMQMGMDRMITVVRPDLKVTLVIYPALKAYAATALSSNEVQELQDKYTITKKSLGQETIDGRRCDKCQVTLKPQKGMPRKALVWYAPDLKRFPVQIQMAEEGTSVIMLYRQIKLEKPAPSLFDVPADFTKYPGIEQLMQAGMTRMFGGQK